MKRNLKIDIAIAIWNKRNMKMKFKYLSYT